MKKSIICAIAVLMSTTLFAQTTPPVVEKTAATPSENKVAVVNQVVPITDTKQPVSKEHPLVPVLKWAYKGRPEIAKVKDYTAILTKQENVDGEVQPAQMMEIKVRHEPFSVYLKFRWPREMAGQEAIYIKGQNDGKMIAHGVGLQRRLGALKLEPEGLVAMRGNKYPITEIGLLNLVDKLVQVGEKDVKYDECKVEYFSEGVKMDDRECTMIQVTHPIPRKNFIFCIARIIIDNELNVPIRYESYEWPIEKPTLIEAYTYQKLKLNVGLTDADFDSKNEKYDFPN